MAKKKRQRPGKRKRRVRGNQANSTLRPASEVREAADSVEGEGQNDHNSPALTHAFRFIGIAPIAFLVAILALHDWFPRHIPHWFQPIVDGQVAVLTLSAGHATIIGLWVSSRGRFNWSSFALLIAASATALAGFRTIGDSTSGHVVTLMLFLLTVSAAGAEWLSAVTLRIWTRRGFLAVLAVLFVVLVAYNQARDENYIRNWLLIPLGIMTAIVVGAWVLWLLIRLIYRYAPIVFGWLGSGIVAAYRRLLETTGSVARRVRRVPRSGRPRMRERPSSRARRVGQSAMAGRRSNSSSASSSNRSDRA